MEIVTVSLVLRLDVEAIQDRADLVTWAKVLGIGVGNPGIVTWSEVYEELTKVLVGAEHYSKYSLTAIADMDTFTRLVRTSEIRVHRGEISPTDQCDRVSVPEQPTEETPRPTLKVVATPPPPPRPRAKA